MKRVLLALCVLFAFPSLLWAQDAALKLIERSPYPEDGKLYLLQEVPRVFSEAGDVPEKLLLKKLREGIAKRVPPEDLVAALEKRKAALQEAGKLLEEMGIQKKETLLEDLAVSFELSLPPEVLRKALQKVASNPKAAERFVDVIATFLEVGVPSETAQVLLTRVAEDTLEVRDVRKIAQLLEQARQEGMDMKGVASCLENALAKHGNLALVEVELQNFIAANKPRPALRSGQGVVAPPAGISGGTPTEEGGAPLEPQPTAGHPPTQEGGTPLE